MIQKRFVKTAAAKKVDVETQHILYDGIEFRDILSIPLRGRIDSLLIDTRWELEILLDGEILTIINSEKK